MLARIDGRVPVVLFYKLRVTWTNPMVVELGQNASSWNVAAVRTARGDAYSSPPRVSVGLTGRGASICSENRGSQWHSV
ncbi:MAG: hypothetical protein KDA92_20655 [Planctomycetales bacterium]|nr:hypothetical protein [Planctomycetales bacterium]